MPGDVVRLSPRWSGAVDTRTLHTKGDQDGYAGTMEKVRVDSALDVLKRSVCAPGDAPTIGQDQLLEFAAHCTVALPVGGEGSRLRTLTDGLGIQKNALRLPNGETL